MLFKTELKVRQMHRVHLAVITEGMRQISWISHCGDCWQQAELRTDCRILMMMMMRQSG